MVHHNLSKSEHSCGFWRIFRDDYVYLQDLFVTSELRGKGVGKALVEHVYAAAKVQGGTRVWWLTHETNTDAMHLYDKIADKSGFVQYRKLV